MAEKGADAKEGGGPPPFFNALVKVVLRSPLHGLFSKRMMLLGFTGRKTGKHYLVPIRYIEQGDTVACFTDSGWWRNLLDNRVATVRVKGRDYRGPAELERDDEEAIARGLRQLVEENRGSAGHYDVRLDPDGQPNAQDLAKAAHERVMVRVPLRA